VKVLFLFLFCLFSFTVFGAEAPKSASWAVYFTAIVTALLAISECLAVIPSLKSNSILQLFTNILKSLAGKGDE